MINHTVAPAKKFQSLEDWAVHFSNHWKIASGKGQEDKDTTPVLASGISSGNRKPTIYTQLLRRHVGIGTFSHMSTQCPHDNGSRIGFIKVRPRP